MRVLPVNPIINNNKQYYRQREKPDLLDSVCDTSNTLHEDHRKIYLRKAWIEKDPNKQETENFLNLAVSSLR